MDVAELRTKPMKIKKSLSVLIGSASIIALMTVPALAVPITIIAAGINLILASFAIPTTIATIGATVISIGQIVAVAAIAGGAYLYSTLSGQGQQRQQPSIDPGQVKSTFESAEAPELRIIGRARIGGLKAFGNTNGKFRYRVIAHCKGEIPLSHIEQYYLGGKDIGVEINGEVSTPPFAKMGGSYVTISHKSGSPNETAWPELIAKFPTQWTVNHRLRGIMQTLIRYESPGLVGYKFQRMYQSGVPDLEMLVRGEEIYDPRISGYAWSDNGVLACLHIVLTFPELSISDFDMEFISESADRADQVVSTLTGSEKRSRVWGVWSSETPRGVVLQDVLKSAGCRIFQGKGGLIKIDLFEDNPVSEWEFAEKHMLDLKFRSGPESVERPNICKVSYYSPETNYAMTEINLEGKAWARIDGEIERVGKQDRDYQLKFCPSASQAQRIARRLFAYDRSDSGVLKTNFAGLGAWGKNFGTITLPGIDVAEKCALLPMKVLDDEGSCEIPFIVVPDLLAWNPVVDEAPAPTELPSLQQENDIPTPTGPQAVFVTYRDGTHEARVFWTATSYTVEARYRIGTPWLTMTQNQDLDHAWATLASLIPFDARYRFFDANEDSSEYSPIVTQPATTINTAPTVPTISVSYSDGDPTASLLVVNPSTRHIVTLEISGGTSSTTSFKVRPGETVTEIRSVPGMNGSSQQNVTFSARCFTSNNTPGATSTATIVIPANL